jgi:hypothetical protein
MGNAGIEIDAVALLDDQLLGAMKKSHGPFENVEDFLAFVLVEGAPFLVYGESQDERFHDLVREGVGHGLIGIVETCPVPGDDGSFSFADE